MAESHSGAWDPVTLLPEWGQPVVELDAMQRHLTGLQPDRFAHGWRHPDHNR